MIMIILVTGISLGLLVFSFNGSNEPNISESTKNLVYIPSNITKANPNILQGSGGSSMITTNIEDVQHKIKYTIQGKVLRVDDPIRWISSNSLGRCNIPVTISIDNIHKGIIDYETFTFHVEGFYTLGNLRIGDIPILSDYDDKKCVVPVGYSPQVEIGEEVIVHITKGGVFSTEIFGTIYDEKDLDVLSSYYYVTLGPYGKYKIQNDFGYNENYPDGKLISQIQIESTVN